MVAGGRGESRRWGVGNGNWRWLCEGWAKSGQIAPVRAPRPGDCETKVPAAPPRLKVGGLVRGGGGLALEAPVPEYFCPMRSTVKVEKNSLMSVSE